MAKTLQEKLEDARKQGIFSDEDIKSFNIAPSLPTTNVNVHNVALDKTGEGYKATADETAKALSTLAYDSADKKTDIETSMTDIKEDRSDDTRKELLKTTGDFDTKQDNRYQEVKDITARQENIANRQANIAVAKAGKYGDIFSDGAMMNIKNDVIAKYGQNILNAEQYALTTNRTIDNDLLNVGLKEVADKNVRNAFKDVLLEKENSYMLNAIKEAADGNKKAIKDVETFYQTYTKLKATDEAKRSAHAERRQESEKEFSSYDPDMKATTLRDYSYEVKGYSLVADMIPRLISDYPNLSLSELKGKVTKVAEKALTANQQISGILEKEEKNRTQIEKDLLNEALFRGLEIKQQSDRSHSETVAQAEANKNLEAKTGTVYDKTPEGQAILTEHGENKIEKGDAYDKSILENKDVNKSQSQIDSDNDKAEERRKLQIRRDEINKQKAENARRVKANAEQKAREAKLSKEKQAEAKAETVKLITRFRKGANAQGMSSAKYKEGAKQILAYIKKKYNI